MPVTAKLSKAFYDRFGEQTANELVDWFNAVDAAYKSDLRELNEANYARFEAKLEQRLAEFAAGIKGEVADVRGELRSGLAGMEAKLERRLADQTRSMYLAWAVLLAAIVGLYAK